LVMVVLRADDKVKNEMTIEVEADTLDEARVQLKSCIPEGSILISQDELSVGKPKVVFGIADTVDMAFQQASSGLPSSIIILEKKVLSTPEFQVVINDSFTEDATKMYAFHKGLESVLRNLHSTLNEKRYRTFALKRQQELVKIKAMTITEHGKHGVFGIGKKPNSYKIEIAQQAVVEIRYKKKASIRALVLDPTNLEQLIEVIHYRYDPVVDKAVENIVKLGKPAVDRLIVELLKIENTAGHDDAGWEPHFHANVVVALRKMGELGFMSLIETLKDRDELKRILVLDGIDDLMSPFLIDTTPTLTDLHFYPNAPPPPKDYRIYHAIIDALTDEEELVRERACAVLESITLTCAREEALHVREMVIDPLIRALDDESHRVRNNAARTLAMVGDARALEPLTKALKRVNKEGGFLKDTLRESIKAVKKRSKTSY
jgi:hypothetical protein